MAITFNIKTVLPASPKEIYEAWLDSKKHSAMTGGMAKASNEENVNFSAWDGYISGKNLHLEANQKIVQAWRTTDFKEEDDDSVLELNFKTISGGCEISLTHSNIPEGSPDYETGWENHYFKPMRQYFAAKIAD